MTDASTTTAPVFVISVAAELAGLHPQTLRTYDRLGLVSPDRTAGRGRRYSARDIAQLREVQRLSQEEGVNLAGIKRILELENQVAALRAPGRRAGGRARGGPGRRRPAGGADPRLLPPRPGPGEPHQPGRVATQPLVRSIELHILSKGVPAWRTWTLTS